MQYSTKSFLSLVCSYQEPEINLIRSQHALISLNSAWAGGLSSQNAPPWKGELFHQSLRSHIVLWQDSAGGNISLMAAFWHCQRHLLRASWTRQALKKKGGGGGGDWKLQTAKDNTTTNKQLSPQTALLVPTMSAVQNLLFKIHSCSKSSWIIYPCSDQSFSRLSVRNQSPNKPGTGGNGFQPPNMQPPQCLFTCGRHPTSLSPQTPPNTVSLPEADLESLKQNKNKNTHTFFELIPRFCILIIDVKSVF